MSIDSRLWDYASESILSGIERDQKELDTGLDFQSQAYTYMDACESMALQGKVMRDGSEVGGEEASRYWNGLYTNLRNCLSTNLRNSAFPSDEDESTCLAEMLPDRYLHLKKLTEEFMKSGTNPAWVKGIIESVRSDAADERNHAISDMIRDLNTLSDKHKSTYTHSGSDHLCQLSQAAKTYAEQAVNVNGPTVDLITTGIGGVSHHGLEHDDASRFMGAMSYYPRKTHLEPLAASSTFGHEDLVGSIADAVLKIETSTDKILFAHQELDDTGEEQYGDPKRMLYIPEVTLWRAEHVYNMALAEERRKENSMAASRT